MKREEYVKKVEEIKKTYVSFVGCNCSNCKKNTEERNEALYQLHIEGVREACKEVAMIYKTTNILEEGKQYDYFKALFDLIQTLEERTEGKA